MFSIPPMTNEVPSPALIACAASIAAFSDDPQTLLTVNAARVSGRPAPRPTWRAGFWPSPAWSTQPKIASSMWSVKVGISSRMALSAIEPRSVALMRESPPSMRPSGVLL